MRREERKRKESESSKKQRGESTEHIVDEERRKTAPDSPSIPTDSLYMKWRAKASTPKLKKDPDASPRVR